MSDPDPQQLEKARQILIQIGFFQKDEIAIELINQDFPLDAEDCEALDRVYVLIQFAAKLARIRKLTSELKNEDRKIN